METSTSSWEVNISVADGVMEICLNRPTKMNAMHRTMYADVAEALKRLRTSDDIKAVVFSSEGAGTDVLEQYGMTETRANLATTPFHGEKLRGSVGYRAPFTIRVGASTPDDGSGPAAPPGVIGPVNFRGPNAFPGYLSPKHNKGLFLEGGFMSSGDLGYRTSKGQLVLTGREKDLIIRSAHNIDPSAIEEVANGHPGINLSAAVGMPDAYAGEAPVIYVEPRGGAVLDGAEVLAYITERIHEPPAKPRHVFIIPEIPRTGVGKS